MSPGAAMMMTDLVKFLTARLDEDEAVANDVRPDEYLSTRDNSELTTLGFDTQPYRTVAITSGRVLAEVEAKRRILAIHQRNTENGGDLDPDCTKCMSWETGVDPYDELVTDAEYDSWPCDTVKALASVYANHPDYRPEWFVSIRGGTSRISS